MVALSILTTLPIPNSASGGGGDAGSAIFDYIAYVRESGAAGDVQEISDAFISIGQRTLTSATNPFVPSDVGKLVLIAGAGGVGVSHATYFTAYNGPGSMTVNDAAIAGVTGNSCKWGTDDTAKIQAVVNTFKQAVGRGNGKIVFGNLAGANAQYAVNDQIDFGDNFVGQQVTSDGWGSVNAGLGGNPNFYRGVGFHWLGADGQNKAIFKFGDGSTKSTVSRLGFTVTDGKGVWFKPAAGTGRFYGNIVESCEFASWPNNTTSHGIGIQEGFDVGDSSDADIGETAIFACTFFTGLRYGVLLNSSNNGYQALVERCHFANNDRDALARGIRVGNFNNITLRHNTISRNGAYVDGSYFFESSGTVSGWLHVEDLYSEIPTVLKVASLGSTGQTGALIVNLNVNDTSISASPAVDIAGYATVINSSVSSHKTVDQQRTIRATEGGIYMGRSANNSGAGSPLYDLLTGGAWLRVGDDANAGGSGGCQLTLALDKALGSVDALGGVRKLIQWTGNALRIGESGKFTVFESNDLFFATGVVGILTLVNGEATFMTTHATSATSRFHCQRISHAGTAGAGGILAVSIVDNVSVLFRSIKADGTTETGDQSTFHFFKIET